MEQRLTNPENNNEVVMLLIIYETHCRYLEVKMVDCSFILSLDQSIWILCYVGVEKTDFGDILLSKEWKNISVIWDFLFCTIYNLQDVNICELIVQKLSIILK